MGDAEIIPIGTRGRPGRGSGKQPSSAARGLAPQPRTPAKKPPPEPAGPGPEPEAALLTGGAVAATNIGSNAIAATHLEIFMLTPTQRLGPAEPSRGEAEEKC